MNLTNQIIGRVEDKVIETLLQAQTLYGRAFELPSIEWNLRGACAGLAHARDNRIHLNPILLSENTEHFIAQTVPHEIAHLVNRALHGHRVRPHDPEWKSIMHAFGLPALRCHKYDVANARTRMQRRYDYHCNCRSHPVSQIMHNRIRRGWTYFCRRCGTTVRPAPSPNMLSNLHMAVKTETTDEREPLRF
jgi:SprT protein